MRPVLLLLLGTVCIFLFLPPWVVCRSCYYGPFFVLSGMVVCCFLCFICYCCLLKSCNDECFGVRCVAFGELWRIAASIQLYRAVLRSLSALSRYAACVCFVHDSAERAFRLVLFRCMLRCYVSFSILISLSLSVMLCFESTTCALFTSKLQREVACCPSLRLLS